MGSKSSKNSGTSNVYLEIEIDGTQIGNVVIELYDSLGLSHISLRITIKIGEVLILCIFDRIGAEVQKSSK